MHLQVERYSNNNCTTWRSGLKRRLCAREKTVRDGEGHAQGGGLCTRVQTMCNTLLQ